MYRYEGALNNIEHAVVLLCWNEVYAWLCKYGCLVDNKANLTRGFFMLTYSLTCEMIRLLLDYKTIN